MPDGSKVAETYTYYPPMMVIGNLIIGEKYAEPQGLSRIVNETTGDYCEMDFKARGTFSTRESDLQFVSGHVKTKIGETKYTLSGKYLEKLEAKCQESGQSFTVFESPKFPKGTHDQKKMYGMNLYALQMNYLTD